MVLLAVTYSAAIDRIRTNERSSIKVYSDPDVISARDISSLSKLMISSDSLVFEFFDPNCDGDKSCEDRKIKYGVNEHAVKFVTSDTLTSNRLANLLISCAPYYLEDPAVYLLCGDDLQISIAIYNAGKLTVIYAQRCTEKFIYNNKSGYPSMPLVGKIFMEITGSNRALSHSDCGRISIPGF